MAITIQPCKFKTTSLKNCAHVFKIDLPLSDLVLEGSEWSEMLFPTGKLGFICLFSSTLGFEKYFSAVFFLCSFSNDVKFFQPSPVVTDFTAVLVEGVIVVTC